ncbi:hypothetical protein ACFRFU_19400 [Streptomyces sp. NPDC056704]|uniref:hypothetical protein n=1 Tax=Streptomyces sp. NPDC056704 TaxID=3345917 RepID=UPI003684B367
MQIVYASEGGSRFHSSRLCDAFLAAQELWRFDPMQWVPGMPQIMLSNGHRLDEMSIVTAMVHDKEACSLCFPGLRAAWYRGSSENDYGHEPVSNDREFFGEVPDDPAVCGRCTVTVRALVPVVIDVDMQGRRVTEEQWITYPEPVRWPCTSALVLGLAPREVTA